jgi:hypothetical protein
MHFKVTYKRKLAHFLSFRVLDAGSRAREKKESRLFSLLSFF